MSSRAQPGVCFFGASPPRPFIAQTKIMSSRAQPRDQLFVAWRECLQSADPSAALGMTSGSGCCEWAPSCARLTTLGSRLRGNDAWRRLRQKCGAQFCRAHLVLSLRRRPQSSGVRGASTTYFSAQKLKLCHPERSRGICFFVACRECPQTTDPSAALRMTGLIVGQKYWGAKHRSMLQTPRQLWRLGCDRHYGNNAGATSAHAASAAIRSALKKFCGAASQSRMPIILPASSNSGKHASDCTLSSHT